jgi:hypothetical protein
MGIEIGFQIVVCWHVAPWRGACHERDADAAKRFFRKALAQPHTVNPRTITVTRMRPNPKATEMKKDAERWRRSRLRQVKYLNNIVEQDHRRVKRLTRPGLGFGGFWTARRTLAGYEAMAMIRKGQVRNISGNDIRAPGGVHRRTVPGGRLRRRLIFSQMARGPALNLATEPSRLRIGLSSRSPHTSMVFGVAPAPQIGD